MSELQTALLAIGLTVIVAVYLYGWWQQRKYRRRFGASFKAPSSDALYREAPTRPATTYADEAPAVREEVPTAPAAQEVDHFIDIETLAPPAEVETPPLVPEVRETPHVAPIEEAHDAPLEEPEASTPVAPAPAPAAVASPAAVPQDENCALLDVRSDFILELVLAEPAPAAVLGGLWQRKFDFGKPMQVCGLTLTNPAAASHWERAPAEGPTLYSRFRIALQLVDRSGAVPATKLADFRDLVLGIARLIGAAASVADLNQTHQNALELDAFCAEVDQMVGLNLVVPGERQMTGARIAEAAALQGLTLEADGAFHLLGAQGHSLFALINQDSRPFQHHMLATHTTRGLTLLLDVPRVEAPAVQFDRMLDIGRALARDLQLNMVDDQRIVLTDAGLTRIRQQITAVEARMREHAIAPGSAQARRLFA